MSSPGEAGTGEERATGVTPGHAMQRSPRREGARRKRRVATKRTDRAGRALPPCCRMPRSGLARRLSRSDEGAQRAENRGRGELGDISLLELLAQEEIDEDPHEELSEILGRQQGPLPR